MRHVLVAASLGLLVSTVAAAQTHTIVALSHTDNTAYELDPETGRSSTSSPRRTSRTRALPRPTAAPTTRPSPTARTS